MTYYVEIVIVPGQIKYRGVEVMVANFNEFMNQAKVMKTQVKQVEDELEAAEFEGKSGGGMVIVKVSGKGDLKAVNIDKALLNEGDKGMLEDLIVAAYSDGKAKSEDGSQNIMSKILGDMNFPFK